MSRPIDSDDLVFAAQNRKSAIGKIVEAAGIPMNQDDSLAGAARFQVMNANSVHRNEVLLCVLTSG
jgi:hypothetical protein